MRIAQISAVLLCALTLALAAAGCGGGKSYTGAKPDVWAATVCGALGTWADGLKADSARLSSSIAGATDIKLVKTKFVAFLVTAERSSRTMVLRISGAGPPAVKDGTIIQQQLVDGLSGAQASFARAISRAKNLSTADPKAFGKGVQALGGDVQKELTAVGDNFTKLGDKYKDGTLNKATSKEPSCAKISA
jgi:hypothetical protein